MRSVDEYLERKLKFPESRRKVYYLMAIHEHLPRVPKPDLKLVGWSKAIELVKVARKDREQFDCATWLHLKTTELPKEEFKQEVEKHLTGQDTEPWEIIYFELYKSQLPVIEQAVEQPLCCWAAINREATAWMMCADFLAGANLESAEVRSPTAACPHVGNSAPSAGR